MMQEYITRYRKNPLNPEKSDAQLISELTTI